MHGSPQKRHCRPLVEAPPRLYHLFCEAVRRLVGLQTETLTPEDVVHFFSPSNSQHCCFFFVCVCFLTAVFPECSFRLSHLQSGSFGLTQWKK